MPVVEIAEVKTHLRIQNDLEDSALEIYIAAADEIICNYCNLDALPTGESPDPVPASMRAAALLIVGDLYKNKEANLDKQAYANPAVDALLYPYRENLGI